VRPSTCFRSRSVWLHLSRHPELSLKTRAAVVLGLLPAALVLASPATAGAEVPDPSAYRHAVEAAYNLVVTARTPDSNTARQALSILEAGTGQTQPEIVAALERNPPDFVEARDRMRALLDAIDLNATTPNPAQAQQQLHDVLSMHRYDPLHRTPSPLDRFFQWVGDRIADFLRLLFGRGGAGAPGLPVLVVYFMGVVALMVVALVVFRATRGRFRQSISAGGPAGPRAPADYFAEADRYAAQGDRVRAIRALCAGVAATISGERTWEGSPLTVREIFLRAPDPARLRPLLIAFEGAVYGGREVDAAAYEQAAQVAAPFRQPKELAA
jgi:hypothetical protein